MGHMNIILLSKNSCGLQSCDRRFFFFQHIKWFVHGSTETEKEGGGHAQRIADDEGYDLVEIAPQAKPPVCRIMDYGKFKYDQAIKAKQARKNQSKIETKEMKFRPKIDVGDYTTKKKHVIRFLEAGSKVKITIMFRGREMSHPEQGLSILERLADDLKDVAVIENQPKMEGRNMHMLIAPLPTTVKKKKDEQGKDN